MSRPTLLADIRAGLKEIAPGAGERLTKAARDGPVHAVDELLDRHPFEAGVLRVEADPCVGVEFLPGVDVAAGEVRV